jgi:hypothetical protein
MELSRRTLLGAGAGLVCSRPIAATILPVDRGYLTPEAFGAIAGDPDAGDVNVRAFNAMAERAAATGKEMIIPPGVWYLKADGRVGGGWTLRPAAGRPCLIRGEGAASVIRRAPAASATKFASMIRLWVTAGGESFDLQGFAVDGNEAAFPYDPEQPYAYQQAHCILLAGKPETGAAALMRVRDLTLAGVVADGIKIGAQCDRFEAERVMASGRSRRTRSDIQFSRLPRLATVRDCILDAFESEPQRMVQGATMRLRNLVARTSFDLAAPDGEFDGRLIVDAANCQGGLQRSPGAAAAAMNFYRLEGRFTDCVFATATVRDPAHNNAVRGCDLSFERTAFTVAPSFANAATAAPLFARFERAGEAVRFTGCRFEAAPGVAHGAYVGVRSTSPSSEFALVDCTTGSALDYVADATGAARITLTGGALKARKAVVRMSLKAARRGTLATAQRKGWKAPRTSVVVAGDGPATTR